MNSKWKNIVEDQNEYREIMLGSGRLRERLSELLEKEVSALEVIDDYEKSNWHLLQAEANGKRKAYQLILRLINEKGND